MEAFVFNLFWILCSRANCLLGASVLTEDSDFAERRGGVKRKLCCGLRVSVPEFRVSCISNALKVLRNDLKMYETVRTGSDCSGEKLEKSTAIQVDLSHLSVVFQCTHRPPRARSTIAIKYLTGRTDQGQFEHLEVGEVQWFDVGMVDSIVTVGRADRWHPVVVGVGGWQGRLGVCSVSFLFAALTPNCIRGYPGIDLGPGNA